MIIVSGQTNGNDIFSELDPLLELDEGQVVLVGKEVVLRVNDLLDNLELDGSLGFARRGKVPLADSNPDLWNDQAERGKKIFFSNEN